MLSSSNPDFCNILLRSARIMFTQLVTMASVIAISRMIRAKRVRLCLIARRIGPTGMASPLFVLRAACCVLDSGRRTQELFRLLHFQLHRRRDRADAPRWIDSGQKAGDQR